MMWVDILNDYIGKVFLIRLYLFKLSERVSYEDI